MADHEMGNPLTFVNQQPSRLHLVGQIENYVSCV